MGLTLSFFRFTKIVHLHPPWPGSNAYGRNSQGRAVCGRPLLRSAHILPADALHGRTAWGFRTCYNLWEDYCSDSSSFFSFLDYFCLFIFHVNSRFSSSSSRGKAVYSATPPPKLLRNSFIKLSRHTPSSTSQQHFAQLTPSCQCASMFLLPHQLFTSTESLSAGTQPPLTLFGECPFLRESLHCDRCHLLLVPPKPMLPAVSSRLHSHMRHLRTPPEYLPGAQHEMPFPPTNAFLTQLPPCTS